MTDRVLATTIRYLVSLVGTVAGYAMQASVCENRIGPIRLASRKIHTPFAARNTHCDSNLLLRRISLVRVSLLAWSRSFSSANITSIVLPKLAGRLGLGVGIEVIGHRTRTRHY